MSKRNPPWERDELILALDLYFRISFSTPVSHKHPEIEQLSELLNKLPIHAKHKEATNYRNPSGVYMKLCNFLRLDPNYPGQGLDQGSKRDVEVWNEFSSNLPYLRQVADSIKIGYTMLSDSSVTLHDDEEYTCSEGRILYQLHRTKERNRDIVKKAKELAIKNGHGLVCCVCNFNFQAFYGEVGKGYIECHHVKPIAQYKENEKTKLSDLVLVCSNCHKMLHRGHPWMALDELRRSIRNLPFFSPKAFQARSMGTEEC